MRVVTMSTYVLVNHPSLEERERSLRMFSSGCVSSIERGVLRLCLSKNPSGTNK